MNTFFGARSSSALLVGPTLNPPSSATSCTPDPEPLQLGNRVRQQRVLGRIADLGRRGQDQPARTVLGVLGHLRQLAHVTKFVRFPKLPLRIGLASGSNNDTIRSLIGVARDPLA